MTPSPGNGKQPGQEAARGRLAFYQRYAMLVAEQEAALEAGNLELFEDLSRKALELQAGFGETPAAMSLDDDARTGFSTLAEQVAEVLGSTLQRTRRIQSRLAAMKDETGTDIRRASGERPKLRKYMDGESDRLPSLDLKF